MSQQTLDGTHETLLFVHERVIPAAFALLPGRMNSPQARAMLLAIGLQESEFGARVQGGNGPAHGFWQFERGGGTKGVIAHPLTKSLAAHACEILVYVPTVDACYQALSHNDVLACVFARLFLWTAPGALPQPHEVDKGWQQYLETWRPGRPGPARWPANFAEAWRVVSGA